MIKTILAVLWTVCRYVMNTVSDPKQHIVKARHNVSRLNPIGIFRHVFCLRVNRRGHTQWDAGFRVPPRIASVPPSLDETRLPSFLSMKARFHESPHVRQHFRRGQRLLLAPKRSERRVVARETAGPEKAVRTQSVARSMGTLRSNLWTLPSKLDTLVRMCGTRLSKAMSF